MNFKYSLISFSNWMIDSYCPLPESEPPVLPGISAATGITGIATGITGIATSITGITTGITRIATIITGISAAAGIAGITAGTTDSIPISAGRVTGGVSTVVLLESDLSFEFFVLFVVVDLLAWSGTCLGRDSIRIKPFGL